MTCGRCGRPFAVGTPHHVVGAKCSNFACRAKLVSARPIGARTEYTCEACGHRFAGKL